MKKSIKLFLIGFVTFTLTLSIISMKEARASQVQNCMGWSFIESLQYSWYVCECHQQTITHVDCQTNFGCHMTCTPTFCESGPY